MSLSPIKCLITLQWLTGEDGRVSFSKLVLVAVLVFVWHVVEYPHEGTIWPIVWMLALVIAGSHGVKGLQLWFNAAKLNVTGKTESQRLVIERRDSIEGIDPSP